MKTPLEQAEINYEDARKQTQHLCAMRGHQWQFDPKSVFKSTIYNTTLLCNVCLRCDTWITVKYVNGVLENLDTVIAEREARRNDVQRCCGENGHKMPDGSDGRIEASNCDETIDMCNRCHFIFSRRATVIDIRK